MYIPNWFTKSIGFEKPGGGYYEYEYVQPLMKFWKRKVSST